MIHFNIILTCKFTTLNQYNAQNLFFRYLQYQTDYSYLFRFAMDGHHGIKQSNTAWNQISHFCIRQTSCKIVKWLKCRHFFLAFCRNCLFFMSAAYKSDYFGFMLYQSVLFSDEYPLLIETRSNTKSDIII
jgi:hypothetical protein